MTNPHDIIIRPIITENSMIEMENKKYTFVVNRKANKVEIKKAVEKIFDVEVEKINTINMSGKMRRMGATRGKRADWKKAVVKLTPESNEIEFFEGM